MVSYGQMAVDSYCICILLVMYLQQPILSILFCLTGRDFVVVVNGNFFLCFCASPKSATDCCFQSSLCCYSVIFQSDYLLKRFYIIRRYFERRYVLYWRFPATFKLLRAENIQFWYGWCIMFLSSIQFTFISATDGMAALASMNSQWLAAGIWFVR